MDRLKRLIKFFFDKLASETEEIRFSASSLAFSTLLSIVPFFIVILAFFQSVGIVETYYPRVESLIFESMKDATGAAVTRYLKTTLSGVQVKTISWTGALILVISTLNLLKNIDYAFQRIWGLKMKKSFLKRTGLYWTILLCIPIVLFILGTLRTVDLSDFVDQAYEKQFILFTYGTFILWILYTFIPQIKVNFLCSLVSALLASLALSLVQKSFFWLSLKIFKQNKIYGSLASFPIFLLWLLVVWYIILGGVSFCAFLQQKIFRRT